MVGSKTESAPEFTIILPTHARKDVLGFAILSVLAQKESSFELLVVGDGAEDGTAEVVQTFEDRRIKWLNFPKAAGFGYANRNRALGLSTGKYIAFMADDDLIMPDHLALLKAKLDSGADLACTRAAWISSDGVAAPFSNNISLSDEFSAFMQVANSLPATCFAYRRNAIEGPTDHWPVGNVSAGDWRLWHRILAPWKSNALATESRYSVLHFSAKRTGSRFSNMPELAAILRLADNAAWWPNILKLQNCFDLSVQEYYWKLLQSVGADQIREALQLVTDRIAWEAINSLLPRRSLLIRTSLKEKIT